MALIKKIIKDKLFQTIIFLFSVLTIVPLFFILFYIIKKGFSVINLNFLFSITTSTGHDTIFRAIIGSLFIIILASLIAIPPGIITGIYLSENKKNKLASIIRLLTEILQGLPSIVIGILAYLWFVKPIKTFSALSGAISLSIIMLPIIVRSTEETLNLIPISLKEASLALGVPYYKTMIKVILPAGISGISSGILLSIARIAGETAPLLFTAFGNPYLSFNILKPTETLPLLIFNYATSPYEKWHQIAWGASFVLIVIVFILNILARLGSRKWKVKF